MKKQFLAFQFFIVVGVSVQAQKLYFSQDAGGNIIRWEFCEGACQISKKGISEDQKEDTIASQVDTQMVMYPNPTNSMLILEWSKDFKDQVTSIELFDYLGRKVLSKRDFQQSKTSLNLINYPSGNYFAQISFLDGSISNRKIIKN